MNKIFPFSTLTKDELVHILEEIIGTTKVAQAVKDCRTAQKRMEDTFKLETGINPSCSCWKCREIARKLNLE